MYKIYCLFLFFFVSASTNAQVPEWLSDHFEYMTQGSAIWITDNSEYISDQEPMEQYATEWKKGLGSQSITGRLYGIINGEEVGTYWEFRTYWNPVDEMAIAQQFSGGGAVGIGEMWMDGDTLKTQQTFYYPGSITAEIGHTQFDFENEFHTSSFQITPDGEWIENRFYTWKLQK